MKIKIVSDRAFKEAVKRDLERDNNQKEISIKFERHQCEARIPQKFRKILGLEDGDKISWSIDIARKELFGYISKEKNSRGLVDE